MKNLIKELFRKMLSEIEYKDDDYIDFNEINLQHEYDKLNNLLFNGKCIRIPLVWSQRKSAHGHVRAVMNKLTRQITIKELAMSKFYNLTYKNFKDTLAHELIHVYLLQQNINDSHGSLFHREMNRINNMGLGFNITVTLDYDASRLPTKGKELIFFAFEENGKKNIAVMNEKTYYEQGAYIAKLFNNLVKGGRMKAMKGYFYKSSNPLLSGLSIQRSFIKRMSFTPLKDESTYDNLINSAELISSFDAEGLDTVKWEGQQPNSITNKYI